MSRFSAGIISGSLILAGVSIMISLPYQVGIGILAISLIWTLLALPRWGPLRKKWDISPTKILSIEVKDYGFGLSGKNGFPQAINEESLILNVKDSCGFSGNA
jgi:hypothetical protein